jgi:hypothetical protein
MKNKLFILVALVAMLGFVSGVNHGEVWGQEVDKPQEAPTDPGVKHPVPVEFSTFPNDVDQAAALDPLQNLYTEPPENVGTQTPVNTYDFGTTGQVDALANPGDAMFSYLIADKANLLVSFQGDPGVNAVWFETPAPGVRGVQWTHAHLDAGGVVLTPTRELDALEVWGPVGFDDAYFFSMQGAPGGFSVFWWNRQTGAIGQFISQPTIYAACAFLGYVGPDTVDVDGLMVYEWCGNNADHIWNDGDRIIFSIDSLGNWDGGEIVVLENRAAPALDTCYFLNHGGHLWNTAFDVRANFAGVNTENIDAIEAYWPPPEQRIPTLTEWGLIILAVLIVTSGVFILLRRRKAEVPA